MNAFPIGLLLFAVFLLILISLITAMLVSLVKQGDERRKQILEKAGSNTFATMVAYLLFCVGGNLVKAFSGNGPSEYLNPFIMLAVIATIYLAQLLYFKKKYGG